MEAKIILEQYNKVIKELYDELMNSGASFFISGDRRINTSFFIKNDAHKDKIIKVKDAPIEELADVIYNKFETIMSPQIV